MKQTQFTIRNILFVMTLCAISTLAYLTLKPESRNTVRPEGRFLKATDKLPKGMIFWFTDDHDMLVAGLLVFGDHPTVFVSHQQAEFHMPAVDPNRVSLPSDGAIYILSPDSSLVRSKLDLNDTVKNWYDYPKWGSKIVEEIASNTWEAKTTASPSLPPLLRFDSKGYSMLLYRLANSRRHLSRNGIVQTVQSLVVAAVLLVASAGCKTEVLTGGIGGSTASNEFDQDVIYYPRGPEVPLTVETATEEVSSAVK